MAYLQLSQTLADSFNALADEVQSLADRKTVLEHKLRFAHEQFQYLADKYAPAAPEIAETLSKLQLPPHTSVDPTSPVPLPLRSPSQTQHDLALVIRDGRRAAGRLAASLGEASKTTSSSRVASSRSSGDEASSMSTALEQDFTVQGKRGNLQCPFSNGAEANDDATGSQAEPHTNGAHYDPSDPICAAMFDEASSRTGTGNSASVPGKCPIRYLDKHSPEEVARYVEMHKHELPRSHEVCLRRYQRNEQQIRKLDSKYGSMINMIEDLGQLHQPMLPEDKLQLQNSDTGQASNQRVENWAQAVSVSASADGEHAEHPDEDRQSHFDRPMKEVRVGESPSRPWGISVPIYETDGHDMPDMLSPPAAPLRIPSPQHPPMTTPVKGAKKCPFDHTKFAAAQNGETPKADEEGMPGMPPFLGMLGMPRMPGLVEGGTFMPAKKQEERPPSPPSPRPQPAFIMPGANKEDGEQPQMVFTGPVFIGYPMDQALQFMNQYRGNQ